MHVPAQQPDAQLINFLRRLTSGFAAVVAVTGFLVLWGWAFEVSALKSLLPNLATMKPLTALSFLLAGVALWALRTEEGPNWLKWLGHLCAGVITVLGGAILLEYFFNIALGIDRWLFSQAVLEDGGLYPGRPSPTTAFSVFLLGWALLMLDKRPNWLATLLALIVLFICGLAIVGYAYGVEDLYQIQPYSSMALHTALVFILGVFGCLFARPTQSVMGVIHSRFLGGQMARRLLPAAVLLPLILGWLRLQGELAGWYDMRFGLALFASSNIVMFSALMLWNAQQLNQEDVQRTTLHDSLRASEERFAKIFHSSPTAISIARIQSGEIIEANEACLQLLGYTRAEVIGRTAVELGITKAELRQQALQEINHLGNLRNREGVIYTRTGEARNVIISLETSTLNGELCSLTSMFDITERKQAEAQIEFQAHLLNHINDAVLATDTQYRITYWNRAAEALYGWTANEVLGRPTSDVIPTNLTEAQQAEIVQNLRTHGSYRLEIGQMNKAGERVEVEGNTIALMDQHHQITGYVSVNRNITERRRAEALMYRQARLLELAHEPIVIWQLDGGVHFWNRGAEHLYGFSAAEALGKVSHTLLATEHPLGTDKFLALLEQISEWQGELTHTRRDGTRIIVESRQQLIHDETGVWLVLETNRDVTERKRAEAEVQLNQAKLEAGEALVNLGSWELAVGSQQGWWSKQMFRMTGFDPAQGVPSFEAYLNFVHPEDRDLILNALMQMSRGKQPTPQEFRSNPEHGPLRVFSPTYRVEYDAEGQPAKFIGTLLDITERKQAEMLITEALQEKEVLLKEIHHRVKNNLQVIASMLRLQVDGLTDPNARTLLIDNQRRVRSMALIHEQLYQAQDLAHINFNDYVTSLVNYLWRLYAPTQPQVEVQVRIDGVTLGTEQAMPLGLIVNELVSNSMRHAFPAGTGNGQQALWVSATHTADGLLQVEVGDTGVGLPEGFDIEQTTSMGLQLVQAFVMQLRGQLLIQGHPGTLFKMIFPPVKEELWRKPD